MRQGTQTAYLHAAEGDFASTVGAKLLLSSLLLSSGLWAGIFAAVTSIA